MDKQTVNLSYYNGAIPDEELQNVQNELSNVNLKFCKYDMTGFPMACIDLLNPQIYIAFFLGAISSGIVYDVFKWSIIKIWKAVEGKLLTKREAGGKITEKDCTFGLSIDIAESIKAQCILPSSVKDEDKSECIDNLFDFLKNLKFKNNEGMKYLKYEPNKRKWLTVDIHAEIKKLREQKLKD